MRTDSQEIIVTPFCMVLYTYMPADCSCHVQNFAVTQGFMAVINILQNLQTSQSGPGSRLGSAGGCVASLSPRRSSLEASTHAS